MTNTQIALKVRDILCDQLGLDEEQITPEASLSDDLGADSLDTTDLAMDFEESFAIEVTDEDIEQCKTVHACVMLVEEKLAAKAAAVTR